MAASGTARHAGCDLAAMAGALAALLAALDEQWKERLVGGMDDLTNLARLRVSPDLRDEDAADTLALPRAVLAAMLAHVAAGYPDEACGILAGAAGRVTGHFPAENASATPRVFSEIAPEAVLAIWGELEAHGWEMLSYYHSHPDSPAYPSEHDVYWSANWPGAYYIIFSLTERDRPVVRAFLITGERVDELRITVEP